MYELNLMKMECEVCRQNSLGVGGGCNREVLLGRVIGDADVNWLYRNSVGCMGSTLLRGGCWECNLNLARARTSCVWAGLCWKKWLK